MEVDADGTLSYPEPQMTANDNGEIISGKLTVSISPHLSF